MTPSELVDALTAYVAGLDAEIGLLHQIESLAAAQRLAQREDDFAGVARVADRRNRLMAALAELEHRLHPIRSIIVQRLEQVRGLPVFDEAARRHREASDLISHIMTADRTLVVLLEEALSARRQLAHTLEAGGATLAAYRRVLTPAIAHAELVDRLG